MTAATLNRRVVATMRRQRLARAQGAHLLADRLRDRADEYIDQLDQQACRLAVIRSKKDRSREWVRYQ